MLQLNRKTEYALTILAYLGAHERDQLHSARSISQATRIPFDMVTKCLQRLHHAGFCDATQGRHGGYQLTQPLEAWSFGETLAATYESIGLTECLSHCNDDDRIRCGLHPGCAMAAPLARVNHQVSDLLEGMGLAEVVAPAVERFAHARQTATDDASASTPVATPAESLAESN